MKRKEIDEVATSIITRLHERFDVKGIDDLDFIPMIKSAIQGAIDSAEENDLSESEINRLTNDLVIYAKSLYIHSCLVNNEVDSGDHEFIAESEEWFEHIYEHEKYPE